MARTAQATGDRPGPPAGSPAPVPGTGARHQLAAALHPAAAARTRLVLRRGRPPRRAARSTLYTLATTRNLARPPRPATIDALARGLDMPVPAVRAAATALHYYDQPPASRQDPDDRDKELLIASIDELTPEDRRHVAALAEFLRTKPPQEPGGR